MSSAWKKIAIGDVVDSVKTWNPLRSLRDDSFDYVDLSAIDQDSKTIIGVRKVVCGDAPSRARQLVVKGDVLVSTVRPNLNGVALVPEELDGATASTGFCVLRPRKDFLDGTYLFHWVKSPNFISDMVKKATGANYPAVSDRIISESQIPLPPLEEQRRIAEILDRAQSLISKRREAIGQLDTLTQAIFIEMFGDPVTNPKKWTVTPLSNLVNEFRYGSSNKSQPFGKPALRIPNVVGGSLNLCDLKLVPVDNSEFDRLRMKNGDILFVRTNGNPDFVGRCAVFDYQLVANTGFPKNEFIFASYLIRARLALELIVPIFLREFLLGTSGRRELRSRCKTSAGQFNINIEGLGAISIPIPPLPLQQEFARRAEAVEKLKAAHRASLSELDALFASLQHRAFRGEL